MYSQACEVGCQFHLLLDFCSGCQVRCWQPPRAQFSVLSSDRGHCNVTVLPKRNSPFQFSLLFCFPLQAFYGFKILLKRAAKLTLNSISWIAF